MILSFIMEAISKHNVVRTKAIHRTEVILLKNINNISGIRYRQLLRKMKLTNGILSYHLRILERSKKIRVHRVRYGLTRYFPKGVKMGDSTITAYPSNSISFQLIKFMLKKKSFSKFVELRKHTDRSPSTTSWHIKSLRTQKLFQLV